MAKNRKQTSRWEEIKTNYLNCLCYSKENGLYTKRLAENNSPEYLLFRPHGYAGWHNDTITIPEKNINIHIRSNFGYGNKSYLKAIIEREGRTLLDFDINKLPILNNCSLGSFDVPIYEWDMLFKKIISAYNDSFSDKFTTSAIAYIDKIGQMLNQEEISIKGVFHQERQTIWNGNFLISIYTSKKLCDLLNGLELANCGDDIVINHTIALCCKFIQNIQTQDIDMDDSRTSQLSETLYIIHSFMYKHNAGIEFFNLFVNNRNFPKRT